MAYIKWTQQDYSNIIHLLKAGISPPNIGRYLKKHDTKGRNLSGITAMAHKTNSWLTDAPTNRYIITPEQAELYKDASTIPPESFILSIPPELAIGTPAKGKKIAVSLAARYEANNNPPVPAYAMTVSLEQAVTIAGQAGAKEVNYHGIIIKF